MARKFQKTLLVGLLWCSMAWADGGGVLHHLVLVSFTASSTAEQRQQVIDDSYALLGQIPGVKSVSAGFKARDERPVHVKDFDVGIYVLLESPGVLDQYSEHPLHRELLQRHGTSIASIKVVDFFSQR